jgi:hypothetical protein
VLSPAALLGQWRPDGAIWFARACCSAGSDKPSVYSRLFEPGSLLDETLTGIAEKIGATSAPLARALLGASKPLRAFIGHVEPTFDWTLSFPANPAVLSSDLINAIYNGLADGQPVGLAMSGYYPAIAALLQNYTAAREDYGGLVGAAAKPLLDMLVYCRVTGARSREHGHLGRPLPTG